METSENQKTQGPLPTEKEHLTLCYQFIDFGTQPSAFKDGRPQRKVFIKWETPYEKAVFDSTKGEQCFTVGQTYSFSLNTKSTFRKMLDSWLGTSVTELNSDKIQKLLGRPAMIRIENKPPQNDPTGIKRPKIANSGAAVFKRPADVAYPSSPHNKICFFDLDNFDQVIFDSLQDWMKKDIMNSPEYKALGMKPSQAASSFVASDDDFQ